MQCWDATTLCGAMIFKSSIETVLQSFKITLSSIVLYYSNFSILPIPTFTAQLHSEDHNRPWIIEIIPVIVMPLTQACLAVARVASH